VASPAGISRRYHQQVARDSEQTNKKLQSKRKMKMRIYNFTCRTGLYSPITKLALRKAKI